MFLNRRRLRLPALLGALLLALLGATEGLAAGSCARHGETHAGAAHLGEATGVTLVTDGGPAGHVDHTGHLDHAGHGDHPHSGHEGSSNADPATPEPHTEDSGPPCGCRLLCIGVSVAAPSDADGVVLEIRVPTPTTTLLFVADAEVEAATFPPFFLPFATAPPALL